MPIARIAVTAVSDEGDSVIVWGRLEHAPNESKPIGFIFHTKADQTDVALAEQASQITGDTVVVIEYTSIADDWKLARGLPGSQ